MHSFLFSHSFSYVINYNFMKPSEIYIIFNNLYRDVASLR